MGKINSMKITVGSKDAGAVGREAMKHNAEKVFTREQKPEKEKGAKEQ